MTSVRRDSAYFDRYRNIMNGVAKGLEKRGMNAAEGYEYMTADDLYRLVRDLITRNGFEFKCEEDDFELIDTAGATILRVRYRMVLTDHYSGAESTDLKTMVSNFTGAQSCQANRTYAVKYWLRDKFLIPVGASTPDADNDAKAVHTGMVANGAKPSNEPSPVSIERTATTTDHAAEIAEAIENQLTEL